jgi:hypothetical protein
VAAAKIVSPGAAPGRAKTNRSGKQNLRIAVLLASRQDLTADVE